MEQVDIENVDLGRLVHPIDGRTERHRRVT